MPSTPEIDRQLAAEAMERQRTGAPMAGSVPPGYTVEVGYQRLMELENLMASSLTSLEAMIASTRGILALVGAERVRLAKAGGLLGKPPIHESSSVAERLARPKVFGQSGAVPASAVPASDEAVQGTVEKVEKTEDSSSGGTDGNDGRIGRRR